MLRVSLAYLRSKPAYLLRVIAVSACLAMFWRGPVQSKKEDLLPASVPVDGLQPMKARLELPSGKGPFPAMVILRSTDGALAANQSCMVRIPTAVDEWSESLRTKGYVVMFIESCAEHSGTELAMDVGIASGEPQGLSSLSAPHGCSEDAHRAVAYLRQQKRVGIIQDQISVIQVPCGMSVETPSMEKAVPVRTQRSNGSGHTDAIDVPTLAPQIRSMVAVG